MSAAAHSKTTRGLLGSAHSKTTSGMLGGRRIGAAFYTVIRDSVAYIKATLTIYGLISSTIESKAHIQADIVVKEEVE